MIEKLKPYISGASCSFDGSFNALSNTLSVECLKEDTEKIKRLISIAPEMYELLKEELIPTSDYGGIISFERERKIRELLARIDREDANVKD